MDKEQWGPADSEKCTNRIVSCKWSMTLSSILDKYERSATAQKLGGAHTTGILRKTKAAEFNMKSPPQTVDALFPANL